MPVKSKAQAAKLAQMYKEGKITKKTLDEWTEGVDVSELPDRLPKKATGLVRKPRRLR